MKKLALLFIAFIFLQIDLFAQIEDANNNLRKIFSEQSVDAINVNPDSLMLDSIITAYKNSESIPGIATMIIKDNQVIWNNNYGYRNLQSQLPVEDSTYFQIGSISKTFVGTSIMQLWQQGLIDLENNINNYLPNGFTVANPYFPNDSITVKMLMIHTSSLQDNENVLIPLITCGDSPVRLDSFLVRYFTPGRPYYSSNNFYNYPPGQTYNYTNVGYGLLALMVENLTGKSFDEYCRDSIFIPLSMTSSSWFLDGMDLNQIATPYEGSTAICHQGSPGWPEGLLKTNKLEILNYLLAYLNYGIYNNVRILDSATVAYMLSDQLGYSVVRQPPWAIYTQGLSWWQVSPVNSSAWGRGGSSYGFLAYVSLEQTEKWVTIFFQNQRPVGSEVGKILEINYPFTRYAHLYGNIYALRSKVDKGYARIGIDNVLFRTTFSNRYNHQFNANLIYANSDSTILDSVSLFDDGVHGDSLSNDGIYGGYIPPQQTDEDFYSIGVSTIDNQTSKYFNTPDICRFTTAGPVVLDSISYTKTSTSYLVNTFIRNQSTNTTITKASVKLICNDPWVSPNYSSVRNLPNIPPGGITSNSFSFGVNYIDSLFPGYFNFRVEIMSDGWAYWIDTLIFYDPDWNGIEDDDLLPTEFLLSQNYPNPFNSTSVIKYSIPKSSQVSLKIFNTLGQEIETLVDEEKPIGTYELNWNAANLPSGVYFYRFQAGSFVQTRKMILLK